MVFGSIFEVSRKVMVCVVGVCCDVCVRCVRDVRSEEEYFLDPAFSSRVGERRPPCPDAACCG